VSECCYQCERPIDGYYRRRLKDNAPIHCVCLEYVWRETPTWPGGPKAAFDNGTRMRLTKAFTPVMKETA
jgi:hypothetical protein